MDQVLASAATVSVANPAPGAVVIVATLIVVGVLGSVGIIMAVVGWVMRSDGVRMVGVGCLLPGLAGLVLLRLLPAPPSAAEVVHELSQATGERFHGSDAQLEAIDTAIGQAQPGRFPVSRVDRDGVPLPEPCQVVLTTRHTALVQCDAGRGFESLPASR